MCVRYTCPYCVDHDIDYVGDHDIDYNCRFEQAYPNDDADKYGDFESAI